MWRKKNKSLRKVGAYELEKEKIIGSLSREKGRGSSSRHKKQEERRKNRSHDGTRGPEEDREWLFKVRKRGGSYARDFFI